MTPQRSVPATPAAPRLDPTLADAIRLLDRLQRQARFGQYADFEREEFRVLVNEVLGFLSKHDPDRQARV